MFLLLASLFRSLYSHVQSIVVVNIFYCLFAKYISYTWLYNRITIDGLSLLLECLYIPTTFIYLSVQLVFCVFRCIRKRTENCVSIKIHNQRTLCQRAREIYARGPDRRGLLGATSLRCSDISFGTRFQTRSICILFDWRSAAPRLVFVAGATESATARANRSR